MTFFMPFTTKSSKNFRHLITNSLKCHAFSLSDIIIDIEQPYHKPDGLLVVIMSTIPTHSLEKTSAYTYS